MIDRSPPVVSYVIPTLGGWATLLPLLQSLSEHTPVSYETVIVDSGNRTRGYPAPTNAAIRAARGEFVVVLNDDIVVTPGWLGPLLDEARSGTWVCFPDQRASEGAACLCGWCLCFTREALLTFWGDPGEVYDERFGVWSTDIDLAKRLHEAGHPPVCVQIPEPIRHLGNQTTTRVDVSGECQADLERYRQKWGSDPNTDKYELQPVYR